jgi:hypothetical protein
VCGNALGLSGLAKWCVGTLLDLLDVLSGVCENAFGPSGYY